MPAARRVIPGGKGDLGWLKRRERLLQSPRCVFGVLAGFPASPGAALRCCPSIPGVVDIYGVYDDGNAGMVRESGKEVAYLSCCF